MAAIMGGIVLGPFEHTVNSGTNPMKDVITVTDSMSPSNSVEESSVERIQIVTEPKVSSSKIRIISEDKHGPKSFLPNLERKLKGKHTKLVSLYTGDAKSRKVGQYIDFK